MEDDISLEADQLPAGFTPLWLDVPDHTSHLEILRRVSHLKEIRGLSVTVIYHLTTDREKAAEDFCEKHNWTYTGDMVGCEDEAIIAIDAEHAEAFSRPHNLLVVVTDDENISFLNSALRHRREDLSCEEIPNCPYRGKVLLEKRRFTDVNKIDEEYDPDGPFYPNYLTFNSRLESFKKWPLQTPTPFDLASAGFWYTGTGRCYCVRCFMCKLGLNNWESETNLIKEQHRYLRPNCPFVRKMAEDSRDAETQHSVSELKEEVDRLKEEMDRMKGDVTLLREEMKHLKKPTETRDCCCIIT